MDNCDEDANIRFSVGCLKLLQNSARSVYMTPKFKSQIQKTVVRPALTYSSKFPPVLRVEPYLCIHNNDNSKKFSDA